MKFPAGTSWDLPRVSIRQSQRAEGVPGPPNLLVANDPRMTLTADPFPIGTGQALSLTLGVASQFRSRVPTGHLTALKKVRALRPQMLELTDSELKARFQRIGERLRGGEKRAYHLPTAFASVRELSRRVLGKEPYEVQLLGAMAIADRSVAQLKTGEGKTLTGALAASLFALEKKGCHVVTTNAYLAERDAHELSPLYSALGLSVGVTKSIGQSYDEKRQSYACDLTYGHCDTFAFDWLEDQVWWRKDWRVQRGLAYGIVDEADDVLLDAAQQPLVLCGANESDESFGARKDVLRLANEIAQGIDPNKDLTVYFEREKLRPHLTAEGVDYVERAVAEKLGLKQPNDVWSAPHAVLLHQIAKALDARYSVAVGKDYIATNEGLTLVSSTGHPAPGARLRHGLMDAVLLERGQDAQPDLSVIGMISYQAFFNMYGHLSGITGTARGAKDELRMQYGLDVIEIPTHKKTARIDEPDRFYPHPAPRLLAAVADIGAAHQRGQPVLVSTISVNASKHVSSRLAEPLLTFTDVIVSSKPLFQLLAPMIKGGAELTKRLASSKPEALAGDLHRLLLADEKGQVAIAGALEERGLPANTILAMKSGVTHRTLNAETHKEEAEILAAAGQRGAVTVATQMAGRGVDIPLGEGVAELGGLRVVCIEHKTNRRKDDQARGRAGRQGQPGSSVCYVSPADEVFSFLPAHRLRDLCALLPADKIVPAEGPLLRAWMAAVEGAQQRAEINGEADRRRNVKLDRVLEIQRDHVRRVREEILEEPALASYISSWIHELVDFEVGPDRSLATVARSFLERLDPKGSVTLKSGASSEEIHDVLEETMNRRIAATMLAQKQDPEAFNQYVRDMLLFNLDAAWVGHQQDQELQKNAAYLAMYGEKDPTVEHTINASHAYREMEVETRKIVADRFIHHLSQA